MIPLLVYLHAGLCLYFSKRKEIWKDGLSWSIGWLIVFLVLWPLYPILSYFNLD